MALAWKTWHGSPSPSLEAWRPEGYGPQSPDCVVNWNLNEKFGKIDGGKVRTVILMSQKCACKFNSWLKK